jgi:hypothetical protein
MGSGMELVTRCPGEIPFPFDQSKIAESVQKETALWPMPESTRWTVRICASIFTKRRASGNQPERRIYQAMVCKIAGLSGSVIVAKTARSVVLMNWTAKSPASLFC